MMVTSPVRTFEIAPRGAFSLAQANAFEFGPHAGRTGATMSLAFAVDGDFAPAGVELEQAADGTVHGRLHGDADLEAAVAQTARVLSLDHDGTGWDEVVAREAPLQAIADRAPGLRPVLFHSPYEAAAWSVISARIHRTQAARLRDELARDLGASFTLHGETMHAFPSPGRLLAGLEAYGGLIDTKRDRLLGVAQAAEDGRLDVDELHAIGPQGTDERMQSLKGIGPFYARLIPVRATGFADVLAGEPPTRAAALTAYGLPESTGDDGWAELADRWRPFRTWAAVYFKVGMGQGRGARAA